MWTPNQHLVQRLNLWIAGTTIGATSDKSSALINGPFFTSLDTIRQRVGAFKSNSGLERLTRMGRSLMVGGLPTIGAGIPPDPLHPVAEGQVQYCSTPLISEQKKGQVPPRPGSTHCPLTG